MQAHLIPETLFRGRDGGMEPLSFNLYVVGFLVVIGGLVYGTVIPPGSGPLSQGIFTSLNSKWMGPGWSRDVSMHSGIILDLESPTRVASVRA